MTEGSPEEALNRKFICKLRKSTDKSPFAIVISELRPKGGCAFLSFLTSVLFPICPFLIYKSRDKGYVLTRRKSVFF